jgi:hypothetical protein
MKGLRGLASGWGLYNLLNRVDINIEDTKTTILLILFLLGCFAALYSLLRSFLSILRRKNEKTITTITMCAFDWVGSII